MAISRFFFVGAVASFIVCGAQAEVAYDNFGPGFGYDQNGGLTVAGGSSSIGFVSSFTEFTPTVSGTVTSIEVAFGWQAGPNDFYAFTLLNDNGTGPGAGLDATIVHNSPLSPFYTPDLLTVNFTGGASIVAGQTYWIAAATAADNMFAWNFSPNTGIGDQDTGTGTTGPFTGSVGALQVNVNAVPEPAPMCVVGLGALGLLIRRRKS